MREGAHNPYMDGINEILDMSRPVGDIISDLKAKSVDVPYWGDLIKDYEPTMHSIVEDKINRRDRVRSDGTTEKASRIYLGLEKLLTNRITEFMFAIPVKRIYHNTENNKTRQQIASAIEAIYKYARVNTENIRRGVGYFASCEIFTIWYVVESQNTMYGFNSKYKLKCKTYSPMEGCKLYPLFDEYGDMIAMSIEYVRKVRDEEVTYFETYTADKHFKWKYNGNSYENVIDGELISVKKIPGVYAFRPNPIYYGLSNIRQEIEYTLSRNSDIIAYNSAPVLKVAGSIQGEEKKGEARRVYRVENGGDVSYVSWAQSIEALKYHVETLLNMFWTQSQMPDVSFENMKSLGNIGFDARQTLLTDAHLKVGDESGTWNEFFDRESNVIKAFLKEMNKSWANEVDNIEIEHIISPFIQNDEKSEIEKWVLASGGKAVMSQLEAIKNLGISSNPEETLKQIQSEEAASNMMINNVFESAE